MPNTNTSINQKNSRYIQGGKTDIFKNRLGWWERKTIPSAISDIDFEISAAFAGRPDLVAKELYDTPNLQWLVLQFNNIVDINTEFIIGKIIKLPTAERVFSTITTSSVGTGNIIK